MHVVLKDMMARKLFKIIEIVEDYLIDTGD